MQNVLRNPITIWIYRLLKSKIVEWKNKNNNLKIGYLSIATNCNFGNYNTIYNDVMITNVSLGDFTYIANKSTIKNTTIGKFCSIGSNCNIGLGKHPSEIFISTHPIFYSRLKQSQITFADRDYFDEFENIEIGNDVWIGSNVVILDGVKISDGAIVAAGSIVTKDIPPYAIVGGVPAKVIKYRFKQNEISYLLNSKWWDKDINWLKNNFKSFHDIKEYIKIK